MAGTAIFDLDRTLTRQPTWTRFLIFANASRPAFWARVPLLAAHGIARKLGLKSRDSVKIHAFKTLAWANGPQLDALAGAFAARELESGLRARARDVIEAHRQARDRIVLATAAVDFVAERIAQGLGFDQVICTRVERAEAGARAPRLAGANCYGAQKLARVKNELKGGRPVTVYTDHVSDLVLMEWADKAVAVNPSSGLARAARERGFEIADWDC